MLQKCAIRYHLATKRSDGKHGLFIYNVNCWKNERSFSVYKKSGHKKANRRLCFSSCEIEKKPIGPKKIERNEKKILASKVLHHFPRTMFETYDKKANEIKKRNKIIENKRDQSFFLLLTNRVTR
jgi:hypothetical protein